MKANGEMTTYPQERGNHFTLTGQNMKVYGKKGNELSLVDSSTLMVQSTWESGKTTLRMDMAPCSIQMDPSISGLGGRICRMARARRPGLMVASSLESI
jgi:hypothetical protein